MYRGLYPFGGEGAHCFGAHAATTSATRTSRRRAYRFAKRRSTGTGSEHVDGRGCSKLMIFAAACRRIIEPPRTVAAKSHGGAQRTVFADALVVQQHYLLALLARALLCDLGGEVKSSHYSPHTTHIIQNSPLRNSPLFIFLSCSR